MWLLTALRITRWYSITTMSIRSAADAARGGVFQRGVRDGIRLSLSSSGGIVGWGAGTAFRRAMHSLTGNWRADCSV